MVEAARRSGALITADVALEQGRDVFAVPGPITSAASQGTLELLRQGACLVASADDVLEELGMAQPPMRSPRPVAAGEPTARAVAKSLTDGTKSDRMGAPCGPYATGADGNILACLADGSPRHLDEVAARTGLPADALRAAVLRLEVAGRICRRPGQQIMRRGMPCR